MVKDIASAHGFAVRRTASRDITKAKS